MCVVSMVTGHYRDLYPAPHQFPPFEWPNYAELVRKARAYDEMTGQKDCPDPLKDAWNKQVEAFFNNPKYTGAQQLPTSLGNTYTAVATTANFTGRAPS